MSQQAARDVVRVQNVPDCVNSSEYLSDVSPRHKPWDQHRGEADDVSHVYAASPFSRHHRYAQRVNQCSQVLGFARDPPAKNGKQKLTLKNAWFCRVRHCPVCQWRRSLMWQARVYRALPKIIADHPQARFLFATFTVKNCEVQILRQQLGAMSRAWVRLTQLKIWPAVGWVRSVEITRGRDGNAHPHYHTLLMVQPEYFSNGYIKQRAWSVLWQQCLRVDYVPVVDVRVVRPNHEPWKRNYVPVAHHIWGALTEVLKYSLKVGDMLRDDRWFLTLVDQVWKTRAVAVGGILKQYIREREREELRVEPGEDLPASDASIFFGWKHDVRRYRKVAQQ